MAEVAAGISDGKVIKAEVIEDEGNPQCMMPVPARTQIILPLSRRPPVDWASSLMVPAQGTDPGYFS